MITPTRARIRNLARDLGAPTLDLWYSRQMRVWYWVDAEGTPIDNCWVVSLYTTCTDAVALDQYDLDGWRQKISDLLDEAARQGLGPRATIPRC